MHSFVLLTALLAVAVSASILTPPVLPLIVRNPYLSTWLQHARQAPWENWPIFWTGQHVGLSIMASVSDAKVIYPLLGRGQDSLPADTTSDGYSVAYPEYLGAQWDATTTNLTYQIPPPSNMSGPLNLTISFLSPITPDSTLRQSIPASYISIHAQGSFSVDLYMDINGGWVSGNDASKMKWDMTVNELLGLRAWKIQKEEERRFEEFNDHGEWGRLYFTAPGDISYQCGPSSMLRQQFAKTSTLRNEADYDFRAIQDDEPVFAFHKAFKLGRATNRYSESVMYTIAHLQDEVVRYASARGMTEMRPLWKSHFLKDDDLLKYHYDDFAHASSVSANFSEQLTRDAIKADSVEYADIVSLSARQVLGATSFSGTLDNPVIFLKEISSNGNCQTVDVIFPAFPFFVYTNPRWLAYLLEPLLEHQLSGQYPNKYSMHDLGAHFPNLVGHPDGRDEYMPVEECGDMLIMALALVHTLENAPSDVSWTASASDETLNKIGESPFALRPMSVDGIENLDNKWGGNERGEARAQAEVWLKKSYWLWKQWTEYLIDDALIPHNQLSTDDFAGFLKEQTNLALRGIIGIRAMSEIANTLGYRDDTKYYRNISETYIKKWQEYSTSDDGTHAKVAYFWKGSWTTLYSLYSDALLCFHPDSSLKSKDQALSSRPDSVQALLSATRKKNHTSANFIPTELYARQSHFYSQSMQKYGLPMDSRHLYTKSDWQLEAAAVASPEVRSRIIQGVAKWLNETNTDLPFTDLFETEDEGGFGAGNRFAARPVVGAHFSLLALEKSCKNRGAFKGWWES